MKLLVEKMKSHPRITLAVGILLSLMLAWISQSGETLEMPVNEESIDTYIPAGYVLVPITIHNSESVDSIFGNHGVVDLYAVNEKGAAQKWALARGVKMLRAPKNPNQFGVLVPNRGVPVIMGHSGAFQVVIHNPKTGGTRFEKPIKTVRRSIIVEED